MNVRKFIKYIVTSALLVLISMGLGLVTNKSIVAHGAATIDFNICLEDSKVVMGPAEINIADSSDTYTSYTLYEKHAKESFDYLGVAQVLLDYADGSVKIEQAVSELHKLLPTVTNEGDLETILKSGTQVVKDNGYQNMDVDYEKTERMANKPLRLSHAPGDDETIFNAQDFIIYLKPKPVIVPSTPDQSSLTADDSASITVGQDVSATTFNAKATDSDGQEIPVTADTSKADLKTPGTYAIILRATNGKEKTVSLTVNAAAKKLVPKQMAVYGLKTMYLYQRPTFKQQQRLVKYPKANRGQRPMFVVMNYARSKAGLLRYHVRDVNDNSKTDGQTGYITANEQFIAPMYYQKTVKRIKVLSQQGINTYRQVNLKKRMAHFKKGRTLEVVGLKHYHLTTRFVLANGQYLTANKKLVQAIQ